MQLDGLIALYALRQYSETAIYDYENDGGAKHYLIISSLSVLFLILCYIKTNFKIYCFFHKFFVILFVASIISELEIH